MTLIQNLIVAMKTIIDSDVAFSDELFTKYKYVGGPSRRCHKAVQNLVRQAAETLPGISSLPYEQELGKKPKWRPDVVLQNQKGDCVCVIEYESLNSSDDRVVSKDCASYEEWAKTLSEPIPLLVITTLRDSCDPSYRLRHTGYDRRYDCGAYNIDHASKEEEIQRNPFLYWYAFYRRWLEERIIKQNLPIYFANFSGKALSLLDSWPTSATPYEPALDEGSDWSGWCETPDEIQEIRTTYKKKLWAETSQKSLQDLLKEYWSREQAAWRSRGEKEWDETNFVLGANRVLNREEACRMIEKVQWYRLY